MSDPDILRRLAALESQMQTIKAHEHHDAPQAYIPSYFGLTTAGVTTYVGQVGVYIVYGNVVLFHAWVSWSAATGTGQAAVTLPFTTANVTNRRGSVSVATANVTFAATGVQGIFLPNTNYVSFSTPGSNVAPGAVNVEAAGEIYMSGWFVSN